MPQCRISPAVRSTAFQSVSSRSVIRPPGTVVREVFYFARDVFFFLSFFLFRHAFSEVPRPIALKLGHMVAKLSEFYNPSPKIRVALPPKNLGAKNMQNFGRFYTTSDFDREYLRNGSRYLKSESKFFQIDSFCVQRKRSRELWSPSC